MKECNECTPDIQQLACKPVDASCVIYNSDGSPSSLNCIADIPSGSSVKEILEIWDNYFCGISDVAILSCVKAKLNIAEEIDFMSNSALLTSIQNWICNYQDINVKVSPSDTKTGYLNDKIITDECIAQTVVKDENGQQKVKLSIDFPCLTARIPLCFDIKTDECIIVEPNPSQCTPTPLTPIISRVNLNLTGINCNGLLQWYNSNNQLVNTGTTITASPNEKYYAKCTTSCGDSVASNIIEVPNIITFTKVRTAVFTKVCGTNECNIPCIGSDIPFSRTYTSTVSQEAANSLAENDVTFAVDGQAQANTFGVCECSDCNCIFPTFNTPVVINATCDGQVVRGNGQISIVGITNADKFGYYIGSGNYNGVGYTNALSLTSATQGNIVTTPTSITFSGLSTETRIVFRLFNQSNNCFVDRVVLLSPPDCTKEQFSIESVSVSCEVAVPVCKNYRIVAGSVGANVYFLPCNSSTYTFLAVAANQTVNRCSTLIPQATGATVEDIGNCQ